MTYVMFLLSEIAVLLLPKLTVFRRHFNSTLLSPPPDDRRLSQTEIDDLVNFLLSRRNGTFTSR